MNRVLLAETAVLLHLETIGIVLLVLFLVVVALLALSSSEGDFNSHSFGTSNITVDSASLVLAGAFCTEKSAQK